MSVTVALVGTPQDPDLALRRSGSRVYAGRVLAPLVNSARRGGSPLGSGRNGTSSTGLSISANHPAGMGSITMRKGTKTHRRANPLAPGPALCHDRDKGC